MRDLSYFFKQISIIKVCKFSLYKGKIQERGFIHYF